MPRDGQVLQVDSVARFVQMGIVAKLSLPPGGNAETRKRLLEKAEKTAS